MKILLDTNMILRLEDTGHVQHTLARSAVDWIDANGHDAVIVPQVMYEYWVVATRPVEHNGLGLSTEKTSQAVNEWGTVFQLLRDEPGIFGQWHDLVTIHDVKGKSAHDARLVAAMKRHGLTHIVTFNKADFVRFGEIQVFTPAEVLSGVFRSA